MAESTTRVESVEHTDSDHESLDDDSVLEILSYLIDDDGNGENSFLSSGEQQPEHVDNVSSTSSSNISSDDTTSTGDDDLLSTKTDEEIVDSIIAKFKMLPAEVRAKVWTEDEVFRSNETEKGRLFIEPGKGKNVVADVTTSIFNDTMKELETKSKKRKRWSERFDGERHATKFKTIVVDLINACCRPEETNKLWLGDPTIKIELLDEKSGQIHMIIKYFILTLLELKKRAHDAHNSTVEKYEGGKTLHEFIEEGPDLWVQKFPIGKRGQLGGEIQKEIMRRKSISKDEFKSIHMKKKLDHSVATYACIYRPDEFIIMTVVIKEAINRLV